MSASSGMSAEGASIASLAPSGNSSAETSISSMLMPCASSDSLLSPSSPWFCCWSFSPESS